MSHWVKVSTKLQDIAIAAKALAKINVDCEVSTKENQLQITAVGRTVDVDIKINDGKGNLGLVKEADGQLAFVGDFYYGKYNEKDLTERMTTRYYIEDAVDKLEGLGYFVDNEDDFQVNERGQIEFTATNPYN